MANLVKAADISLDSSSWYQRLRAIQSRIETGAWTGVTMTLTTDPGINTGAMALDDHLNNLISAISAATSNVFLAYADKSQLPSSVSPGTLIKQVAYDGINATLDSMEQICSNCATYSTFSNNSGDSTYSTYDNICATNSTYENTCGTNSTYSNICSTNSTYSNTYATNSTYSDTCATNSTYSDTCGTNSTFSEVARNSTEITGTSYSTENANMSIASGAYSYTCHNYCATYNTNDTYAENQVCETYSDSCTTNSTYAESQVCDTYSESIVCETYAESLTYSTYLESQICSTYAESQAYSTFTQSAGNSTNATFAVVT